MSFRCSRASEERAEPQLGTASTVRAFLLVESPTGWGVEPFSSTNLPASLRRRLQQEAREHGVRPLMIRRHGRSSPTSTTVFAAYADDRLPWVERLETDDPGSLLDLDLAALGAGTTIGAPRHEDPLFLVCTHGRHDVCCAERGRPVAAALTAAYPAYTWEISHIGGDRFAGNMLVLPHGLYYGRLTPRTAVSAAAGHLAGALDLDHLRGRSSYPFAVQAAEIYLRRELAETGVAALELGSCSFRDRVTEAVFTSRAGVWRVVVQTSSAPIQQLTCRAASASAGAEHALVSLTRE